MSWRDFLGTISGYKQAWHKCSQNLSQCHARSWELEAALIEAEETIRQLELITPRPTPPELTYVVEKDTVWVQKVISGLGANLIRLPLGAEFRLTNKENFLEFIAWDWVDSFEYHKFYRCGNFTISFKASSDQWGVNQVGIVLDYKAGHAYNLIIFPNGKVMLLEPQSDSLFYCEDRVMILYVLKDAFVLI